MIVSADTHLDAEGQDSGIQNPSETGYSVMFRKITRTYLLALAISALICVAGFFALRAINAEVGVVTRVANIAVRQPILLQNAAMYAGRFLRSSEPVERDRALRELAKTRDLMLASHVELTSKNHQTGASIELSEEMRAYYFDEPWNIDDKIIFSADLMDRIINNRTSDRPAAERAFAKLSALAVSDLLTPLNLAVAQVEREMEQKIAWAFKWEMVGVGLFLLVLILQGLFIFQPLARSVARKTTDLLDAKAKVEHASKHDMLTNLPNRRQCAVELEKAIASARRGGGRVAILHIDLDRFKAINDTYGHAVGDVVLVSAARRFERSIRRGDSVARLGGDEFVIIAPIEAEPTEAARIANRIITKMARPIECGTSTVTTAASVGISIFPDDDTDPDKLLVNADIALYRAKDDGRGRVSFFSPDMRREYEQRETIEKDLHQAIVNDEFEVYFQPQVGDDTGRVVGMEALMRWQHPEKGLVSADKFMHVARSSGLIVPIGKQVIEKTLAIASEWDKAGYDYGLVSINLSASQIRDEEFVEFLQGRMEHHHVNPKKVSIEVVEAVLTDRGAGTIGKVIDQLQTLGVAVELDDFGTGYAALSHLKRYSINRLKIDRTFVSALGTESQNVDLIKTLVDVARNFGIEVLAEGVETLEQRTFLNELGCMQVQGYQIARPMDPEGAGKWLSAHNADSRQAGLRHVG